MDVHNDEGAAALLAGVVADAKDLAAAHGEKLKLEVREELVSLRNTIKVTGAATAVIVVAGLLIAQALAHGLVAATGWPLWAGLGIVGGLLATIGYAIARRPRPGLDLVPVDAIAAVKRDVRRIEKAVS